MVSWFPGRDITVEGHGGAGQAAQFMVAGKPIRGTVPERERERPGSTVTLKATSPCSTQIHSA